MPAAATAFAAAAAAPVAVVARAAAAVVAYAAAWAVPAAVAISAAAVADNVRDSYCVVPLAAQLDEASDDDLLQWCAAARAVLPARSQHTSGMLLSAQRHELYYLVLAAACVLTVVQLQTGQQHCLTAARILLRVGLVHVAAEPGQHARCTTFSRDCSSVPQALQRCCH